MQIIPLDIREEIADDPFMLECIYRKIGRGLECDGRVEWEHAHGQINEKWNIIPVCTYHHRGAGLDKDYNRYIAICRADINDLEIRMPRTPWRQIKKHLCKKYEKNNIKIIH
ncbi:hypothetical protein KAR28_04485 [Candidatus Parcubacteria bacterium]|nr:hypothetical protein [Candidatus Parcubacteria bacterium]